MTWHQMYRMTSCSEQSEFFEQAITSIHDSHVSHVQKTIQSNDKHINYVMKKASKRLYYIRELKRAGLSPGQLVQVYKQYFFTTGKGTQIANI